MRTTLRISSPGQTESFAFEFEVFNVMKREIQFTQSEKYLEVDKKQRRASLLRLLQEGQMR